MGGASSISCFRVSCAIKMDVVSTAEEERLPAAWVCADLWEKEGQGELCP